MQADVNCVVELSTRMVGFFNPKLVELPLALLHMKLPIILTCDTLFPNSDSD